MTTTGMLILAALSFGCGADRDQSVLDVVSPGPVGALPQPSGFLPFGTSKAAQRVAGTPADVDTANMAADGLFAILRGGALEAASPTGGAVADSASSMQLAALPVADGAAPVASDATLPHVSGMRSLRRLLVTNAVPVLEFQGDTLHFTASDGTALTVTGVSPLPVPEGAPKLGGPAGFTLSADVHATGTVGGDGGPHPVDLRVRGLAGTLTFQPERDAVADVTIGENGVTVSGSVDGISGTAAASGVSGRVSSLEELNGLLKGHDVRLRLSEVRVNDLCTAAQASLVLSNLQLPLAGNRPTGRVFGSGDIAFDPKLAFAHDGKIAHAAFEVAQAQALTFDAQTDGPRSGTIVASIHYAGANNTDTLTITFVDGAPQVTGALTNLTGSPETVATVGDATTASGSIKFVDGRSTDHKIEVRRRTGGRVIVFRVAIKSPEGLQLLSMVGAVKGDKSLSGTWARGAVPAGTPHPLALDAERAGTFRVSADGQLELVNEGGAVLARGPMPSDWNRGL